MAPNIYNCVGISSAVVMKLLLTADVGGLGIHRHVWYANDRRRRQASAQLSQATCGSRQN